MMNKTLLTLAFGSALAIGNLSAQQQQIINGLDLAVPTRLSTTLATQQITLGVDEAPKYKKVQDVFLIDKIEYTATNTILHFRFECFVNQYSGATFYAPGEQGSWVLKGSNGEVYPLRAVRNVQVNGELKADNISQAVSYWMDWSNDHATYTCELQFDRLPNSVKVADLIEGIGYEKAVDRFNCLNIKLKTWDTPAIVVEEVIEPVVAVEEVVIEEVVENNGNTENVENSLGKFADISWKAYPNPAEDIVNIELSIDDAATIELFNMEGKMLQQVQASGRISQLNVSEYASGTYLVRVTVGTQSTTQQIVKK